MTKKAAVTSQLQVPHTYVIIFFLMIIASILSYIIPGGEYERVKKNYAGVGTREVVVPGSYRSVKSQPQNGWNMIGSVMKGLKHHAATDIVFFILLIGGAFGIVTETRAVEAALSRLVKLLQNREILVIPAVMLAFSFGGASFGMCEETIPFVAMVVPLALELGYDSITGAAMVYVGAMIGFAAAFLNPFTIGIAQGIAGIKPFSGMTYRLFIWVFLTAFSIIWVMRYAKKIKADPEKSLMYHEDRKRLALEFHKNSSDNQGITTDNQAGSQEKLQFTLGRKAVLLLIFGAFSFIVYGAKYWGWYIDEMVAVFLSVGILSGLVTRLKFNDMASSFSKGCSEIANAAIIVGFARAVLVILSEARVMDTILHSVSKLVSGLPPVISVQCMYLFQTLTNFFVPSGSGQAALTMPIMTPLADMVGITRQTAVLAYQFGDGFTNMIIPTSAVTIAVLGMARIPWGKWARWMLPLTICYFLIGSLLLVPPVLTGWTGEPQAVKPGEAVIKQVEEVEMKVVKQIDAAN
jgi:uncharacterized ion transporter superfamily protein YfcC